MEPITGGTITGALNATVQAGLAYPAVYENSTVEVPAILLYETTHDKVPYLIQISGVGKLTAQVARVVSSFFLSWWSRWTGSGFLLSKADANSLFSKLKSVESIQPWPMLLSSLKSSQMRLVRLSASMGTKLGSERKNHERDGTVKAMETDTVQLVLNNCVQLILS